MNTAFALTDACLVLRPHFWSRPVALLRNITLTLKAGEMCALLGANGAGKTTLLRVLLGLQATSSGQGEMLGQPLGSAASRRFLGFLPERPCLPPTLTPSEAVLLAARLSGLGARAANEAAVRALGRLGMQAHRHRRMRTFSKGMLQRVGLAQAIVGEPRLLLLDEPLSGLDPPARRDVRALLAEERARGAAIFFATHILTDVVTSCERAAVLVAGQLRHHATPSELLSQAGALSAQQGRHLTLELCVSGCSEAAWAAEAGGVSHVGRFGAEFRLRIAGLGRANRIVDAVRRQGGSVLSLEQDARDLEILLQAGSPEWAAPKGVDS